MALPKDSYFVPVCLVSSFFTEVKQGLIDVIWISDLPRLNLN